MIRSLFLVAGELSSDRYAARLVTALRERIPGLTAEAVGGPHLRDAGVSLFRNSAEWSAIGVAEALRRAFPIWLGHRALKRRLKANPPDLLVLLDFGAFNVPTGIYARSLGIPVCYAIPPGSWRPDGGRVSPKLASCADAYLSPFRPSERALREAGLDAHWLGHPLLDFLPPVENREERKRQFDIPKGGRVVALLPGSRPQEVMHLTPVMLDAARNLSVDTGNVRFVLPLASNLDRRRFEERLMKSGWKPGVSSEGGNASTRRYVGPAPLHVTEGRAIEALAVADAAMVCSGTATLEAALVGCPMVIGYTGGKAMGVEYLIRKAVLPNFIGLPNLLLDRPLCPELVSKECTPERLAGEIRLLLEGGKAREDQLKGFRDLRDLLGVPGVISRWADFIVGRWGDTAPMPSSPVSMAEQGAPTTPTGGA
jgi:lipid-A-disaccharide synthase